MLELKTCQCRYRAAGNSTTEEVQTFKQLAISLFTLLSYTPVVVALHVLVQRHPDTLPLVANNRLRAHLQAARTGAACE